MASWPVQGCEERVAEAWASIDDYENREDEAVSIAAAAPARHLPRPQRSTANYARLLMAAPR